MVDLSNAAVYSQGSELSGCELLAAAVRRSLVCRNKKGDR